MRLSAFIVRAQCCHTRLWRRFHFWGQGRGDFSLYGKKRSMGDQRIKLNRKI